MTEFKDISEIKINKFLKKNELEEALELANVLPFNPNPELDNIKSITYREMIEEKPQPLEYIVYPWLPTQGIAFIYAASGVGKTLFTLNLAYTIASGGNFLKYKSPKPRRVLYVDGEMAYNQLHQRFMDVVKQQGTLEEDNWGLLTHEKIRPHKLPKICKPEGQEFYTNLMDRENREVLILDNLSMLSDVDENKSEQWRPIQDWIVNLRSAKKTVIVVHHSGKDKTGFRGSSRMIDCADAAISLQLINDDKLENEEPNQKRFKVVFQKARICGGTDILPLDVSLSHGGWNYQSIEQSNFEKVVERINIGMSQKDIAIDLMVSRPYINKLVQKARRKGLLNEK